MNGNWGSEMPGRVLSQRTGWCGHPDCGAPLQIQKISTTVDGSVPIELPWCPRCDGTHA